MLWLQWLVFLLSTPPLCLSLSSPPFLSLSPPRSPFSSLLSLFSHLVQLSHYKWGSRPTERPDLCQSDLPDGDCRPEPLSLLAAPTPLEVGQTCVLYFVRRLRGFTDKYCRLLFPCCFDEWLCFWFPIKFKFYPFLSLCLRPCQPPVHLHVR